MQTREVGFDKGRKTCGAVGRGTGSHGLGRIGNVLQG